MRKKKEKLFKEEYLDDTTLDLSDPLAEIEDPLATDFEISNVDDDIVEKPKKKGLFGRKKNKKDEEDLEDIGNISLDDIDNFEDSSLSIEELEQRERIRQREELAEAEMDRKRAERSAFWESFKTSGTIVNYLVYTVLSTVYVYYLSGVLIPSILVALGGSLIITYWFYFKKNLLEVEEQEFKDLTNVAIQINFNMQNGKNVADTLEYIKDDYDGRIGADLNYTYSKLMSDGELVTENFEEYGFTSFDIFMRNLQIAYHDGVDAKKLFKFPLSNINFEAIERNNLYIKNKASKFQEMVTLGIGVFIPASIRIFASEVYMAFLGYPVISIIFSTVIYFAFIMIAKHLQKLALDVSVSL